MASLALDSSTRRQSVAVASGDRVVARVCLEVASRHSETLLPAVELALSAAAKRPVDLDAVAVTTGPGSFTGVRVGMATAKGLVLGTAVPLVGVSTLRALAEALAEGELQERPSMVCALLEAGRGELYKGLYRVDRDAGGVWLTTPAAPESACPPAEALGGLPQGTLVGGDGALRFAGTARGIPEGVRVALEIPYLAGTLARRVEALARSGGMTQDLLAPNYIRLPDALRR